MRARRAITPEEKRAAQAARAKEDRRRRPEHYRAYHREWKRKWRNADPENRKKEAEYSKRYREKKPESSHKSYIQGEYGLTLEEETRMHQEQNGLCAICKQKRRLVIDHKKGTNIIRQLLCSNCNTAIGLFYEDIPRLEAAIEYLKRWNGT